MNKGGRASVVVSVLVFIFAVGALTRSGALTTIRSVDALLIFAAGLAAGVALVRVLHLRKS